LVAEDSFLVQIKSRSEKSVEFLDGRFKALMSQDLPLFLGRVDLRTGSLELHALGAALAHPNIGDFSGVVAHLQGANAQAGFVDGVLHVALNKPILRMTTSDTESVEFTCKAYEILKQWLALERWNRRHRRSGITRQIMWETNKVPVAGGMTCLWDPEKAREALEDFAALIPLLAVQADSNAELRRPALEIMRWLRGHGIDPDPRGLSATFIDHAEATDRLKKALESHSEADVACTFRIGAVGEDNLDFWLVSQGRDGTGTERRYTGSLAVIRELGFAATVDGQNGDMRLALGLSEAWLSTNRLQPAAIFRVAVPSMLRSQNEHIFLLRKVTCREDRA
jgi:hypothetical protein